MVEAAVKGLIALVVLVIAVYVVLWVLVSIGIGLPTMIVNLIWVIVALIALLIIYRLAKPYF